jgi:hypothetical protein
MRDLPFSDLGRTGSEKKRKPALIHEISAKMALPSPLTPTAIELSA